MEWMKRLIRGEGPVPPQSSRPAPSWDELVAQTRSPDGRQRQAAVRALASSGHAPALPAMLERVNDWVDPIRRDAHEAIGNFLRPEFTAAWIASLEAVEALSRGRRADHAPLLERIVGWLNEPAQFMALEAGGRSLPRELARLALRLRLRDPDASELQDRVWRKALQSSDAGQAMIAAEHLRQSAERFREDDLAARETLRHLVKVAMASRFAGVRNAGLRVALARPALTTPSDIRSRCFDASGNTRQLAIASLRADASALRELTARALSGTGADKPLRTRTRALGGLCSIDRQAGLARCADLRHDASPSLRGLALRHLFAHATAESRDGLVLDALVDVSPRVRRLAVAAVLRGAPAPAPAALQAMAATHPHALASLCSVASRLSPWERVDWSLTALAQAGESDRKVLFDGLQCWAVDMRNTYVTPSATQRERLRRSWAALRDLLPRELQHAAAFHLRAFGVLDT